MKKKLIALTVAALLLTGCSAATQARTVESNVKLKDGRTVTCVVVYGETAALSCDWSSAK